MEQFSDSEWMHLNAMLIPYLLAEWLPGSKIVKSSKILKKKNSSATLVAASRCDAWLLPENVVHLKCNWELLESINLRSFIT